jgi:hypothetical protein
LVMAVQLPFSNFFRERHLDTHATTNLLRIRLSDLNTFIHLKLLVQSLAARKQRIRNFLISLFKGYVAVNHETLRAWLAHKQDDHKEKQGDQSTQDDACSQ